MSSTVRKPRVPRRERILEVATEMFNADGLHAVPLHRIAAEMKISPGNLTYHFPNKAALIRELVQRLKAEIVELIDVAGDPRDADTIVGLVGRLFSVIWPYRFFLCAPQVIATSEPQLMSEFVELRDRVVEATRSRLETTVRLGLMRAARSPNSLALVSENLWAVWIDTLARTIADDGDGVANAAEARRLFMMRHASVLEPYVSAEFARRMFSGHNETVGSAKETSNRSLK